MQHKLPPLNWLRAFEASARHLSFTQAATELHLTQAAISKQVKSLEMHLKQQLFIRKPRSLELTKTGKSYLPKVHDCFERLALSTLEVFGERKSEILTIHCNVSFSVNWLGPKLKDYMTRFPKQPIRIVSSIWHDGAAEEHYDLSIQYGHNHWPGYRYDRLSNETLIPLCHPDLTTQNKGLKKPEDLTRFNLLHVLGYEEGWGIWLKLAGVENINVGHGPQFDTSLLALEVAANGGGVTLGRKSLIPQNFMTNRLIAPFDLEFSIQESFYLLSPITGDIHPHAADFRQWIIEQAAKEMEQNVT